MAKKMVLMALISTVCSSVFIGSTVMVGKSEGSFLLEQNRSSEDSDLNETSLKVVIPNANDVWTWSKSDFNSHFPNYGGGGENIGPGSLTTVEDIETRYAKGTDITMAAEFDVIKGVFPNSVKSAWPVYFKNGNQISHCVTAAGLSIINSIASDYIEFKNHIKRPDVVTDTKAPYVLSDRIGKPSNTLTFYSSDPFSSYSFDESNMNSIGYSGEKYKGFALVNETGSTADIGYLYNQYARMAAVIGGGADTYVSGLDTYLKENTLSVNKKHRYTMEGKRKMMNGNTSFNEIKAYLSEHPSGILAGDDDFQYPNDNRDPAGHAFIIVGAGHSKKKSALNGATYSIPEVVYYLQDGRLAAMPAMDLCDWFDLTIKQQNKEWFGWRTSTDPVRWFK